MQYPTEERGATMARTVTIITRSPLARRVAERAPRQGFTVRENVR